MRVVLALVLAAALAAVAGAAGQPAKNGLPSYIEGYPTWPKLNRKPILGGSPAHQGTKNVYASRRLRGGRYPAGTIVVKTATPPGKKWLSLVATMRRIKGTANGGWRWEEFTRSSPSQRFSKIGFPESGCAACHVQAKSNDYVFTRR
ncbi:MAG: cytochrome P460 family protein [Actinobacteria bacterium]|nr:cytochrome P460 family protein [Actinomycetota bacterium]